MTAHVVIDHEPDGWVVSVEDPDQEVVVSITTPQVVVTSVLYDDATENEAEDDLVPLDVSLE